MNGNVCEVCKKAATVCVTDLRECQQLLAGMIYRHAHPREHHYFCEDHQRPPAMELEQKK